MTRKSGGHGQHTVQLHPGPAPRIADDSHPFEHRPRGEVGAYRCVRCDESPSAAIHKAVKSKPHTAIGVGLTGTCRDCGQSCSRRAARCGPCNLRWLDGMARKRAAIYAARKQASA